MADPYGQSGNALDYQRMQYFRTQVELDEDFNSEEIAIPGWAETLATAALPKAHSMEITSNDPRFFQANVVEKRLAAFGGLSVIASLTTGTALKQTFALSKNITVDSVVGFVQLAGFYTMGMITFMSLTATVIFVYQGFFVHRLITAGPTGFELATEYYLNPDMVRWRHFAVKCLGLGLPLLFFSTGCMLYVKFFREGQRFFYIHGHPFSSLGSLTFLLFTWGSMVLFYIGAKHDQIFREEYKRRVHQEDIQASVRNIGSLTPREQNLRSLGPFSRSGRTNP